MSDFFALSVDRAKSFDDRRAGYGWFDPFASSESFPATAGPEAALCTIPPTPLEMTIDEAATWLESQGKRSADAHELAEFCNAYPDFQKEGRIVAPSAVTLRPYVRRALALDVGKDGKRLLTFVYAAVPLPAGTRLLAVEK